MKSTTLLITTRVLSLLLLYDRLNYVTVTSYDNMNTCYIINLEENNILPPECTSLPLVSKGFFPEITIQAFPALLKRLRRFTKSSPSF